MSVDSDAAFTFTDGVAFPNNAAINATGPSATDGTEFVKIMIDNYLFGPMQAMLDRVSLTPNGVTEAAGASQFIEALQLMGPGPGIGTEWSLATDPAVTGHRAILRQGQGILLTSFPDLINVYVGDGNNAAAAAGGGAFYRADNANGTSPNIAGIYLILDDARGVTTRGLDVAAAIDPDGASRFLGDIQVDALQGHIHYSGLADNDALSHVYGTDATDLPGLATSSLTNTASTENQQAISSVPKTDGVNGTPRTSSETVMNNRSTNYVIWY